MAAKGKNKSKPLGLIPPPPAVSLAALPPGMPNLMSPQMTEMIPQYDTRAPLQFPGTGASLPQINLPEVPNTAGLLSPGFSETEMSGINALRGSFGSELEAAKRRRDSAGDVGSGLSLNPEPDAFTTAVSDKLRQGILNTFAQGDSYGDRFTRGFETGQSLAANILVPAFGAFGGAGNAAGMLQSTDMMNKQVATSKAQRAQERNQMNQSLLNLSSLYEKMDPKSTANVIARVKNQLELMKLQQQVGQQGTDDIVKLLGAQSNLEQDLLKTGGSRKQAYAKAVGEDFGNNMASAGLELQLKKEANDSMQSDRNYMLAKENTGVQKDRLKLEGDSAAWNQKFKDKQFQQDQDKMKLGAATSLLSTQRILSQLAGKSVIGDYPNLMQDFASNPLAGKLLNKIGGVAGVENAVGLFTPPTAAAAAKPADQWGDFMGGVGRALQQVSGQKPLNGAAIGKLQGPEKDQALDATIPQIRERLLQETGKVPTAEQILEVLNGKKRK